MTDQIAADLVSFKPRTNFCTQLLALGFLAAFGGCSKPPGMPGYDAGTFDFEPDAGGADQRCNIQLVSATPNGRPGNGHSGHPTVTPDGKTVSFSSEATDLVPDGRAGLYVRDLRAGVTRAGAVDAEGRPVLASCSQGCLTHDGSALVFQSSSDGLVANDTNQAQDAFWRDLTTGQTAAVSVGQSGSTGNHGASTPSIAGDGRTATFYSFSDDLVASGVNQAGHVYVRDFESHSTRLITRRWDGDLCEWESMWPSLSSDGRWLILSSKCALLDLPRSSPPSMAAYAIDLMSNAVHLISRNPSGNPTMGLDPRLSGDGRRAVYASRVDPNEASAFTYINIFMAEVDTGKVTRLSRGLDGSQPNDDCLDPAMSANGRYVSFSSRASNLVPGDTNASVDVFRVDLESRALIRVSVDVDGREQASAAMESQSAVADDGMVVFGSPQPLLPGTGGTSQIYVYRGCK